MKQTYPDGLRRPRQSIDGFVSYRTPVSRPLPIREPQQPIRPTISRPLERQRLRPELDALVPNPISRQEMELPRAAKRRPLRHRAKTFKKWTLRSATAIIVIILLAGGYLFSKGYLQLHKVFTGGSTAAALNSNVDPSQLKGEGSGRVNILLLGIGGPNHDGPDLTDSIMVVSIDVVNHKMALLSIPRDLWVKEPNDFIETYGKINAAYESGKYSYLGQLNGSNDNINAIKAGFQAADQTFSSVLGIPINYNVLVNFQAFQQAVDAVGGVTVDVPTELYDPTMAWQNNWNPILAQPGVQHMDGYQALLYARSRETTSDFARAARQRAILMALKAKVLTAGTLSNPLKISGLLSALGNNVRTDISLSDMDRLYNIIQGIPASSIDSVDLDKAPNDFVTTGDINGQSIVEPKAGLFDYSAIQSFVRNTMRDGYLAKENALIQVLNGTGDPGLATNETNVLKSYGYNVAAPGDAPTSNYQRTVIVDLTHGRDKYTKHYLEQRFSVAATTVLPPGISSDHSDFVIILGQDEADRQ